VTLEGNTVKATFTDWEGNQAHVEGTLAKDALTGTWKPRRPGRHLENG
jgi:hypothetical protein